MLANRGYAVPQVADYRGSDGASLKYLELRGTREMGRWHAAGSLQTRVSEVGREPGHRRLLRVAAMGWSGAATPRWDGAGATALRCSPAGGLRGPGTDRRTLFKSYARAYWDGIPARWRRRSGDVAHDGAYNRERSPAYTRGTTSACRSWIGAGKNDPRVTIANADAMAAAVRDSRTRGRRTHRVPGRGARRLGAARESARLLRPGSGGVPVSAAGIGMAGPEPWSKRDGHATAELKQPRRAPRRPRRACSLELADRPTGSLRGWPQVQPSRQPWISTWRAQLQFYPLQERLATLGTAAAPRQSSRSADPGFGGVGAHARAAQVHAAQGAPRAGEPSCIEERPGAGASRCPSALVHGGHGVVPSSDRRDPSPAARQHDAASGR